MDLGSPRGNLICTRDSLHSEVEVFDVRGEHRGVIDAVTGLPIKPAREGRKISV
ncbi:MAG TPA: colicin E3/pyocin S6 family cytotoxin [Acetobacteraceae bacterium]|jgi:hypothetical protein|nr:colicin E3/pyocin S6 family cytotoxin [Acetobacteraceae bacterium]